MDRPVTMALLPVSGGVDVTAFAQSLAGELATHDYVLLVGDATPTDWTHRGTRHADEILLLADAKAAPLVHANEQAFLVDRPPRADAAEVLVLMLMHDSGTAMPSGTSRWLARRPVSDHIQMRRGHGPDMARLARIQSRNPVGLVLAGSGAGGFAHLGVYRALCEHGIEVDFVGGTSIGAIMAALIATDQPPQRLEAKARPSRTCGGASSASPPTSRAPANWCCSAATCCDRCFDEMPSGWAMLLDRLRPRKSRRYRLPSLPALLINATILYSLSRQKQARALTDLYFNPPLERVGMLDWKRFDQVVRQGHAHALQALAEQVPAPRDPP